MSDGTNQELYEGGSEDKVTFEKRVEFVSQVLAARIKEVQVQCEAIRRGIAKIVPEPLLNLATPEELETWVCGRNIVDIELLKRHTKYGTGADSYVKENSKLIQWFWEVLREMNQEDQRRFVKFCWA